MTQIYPPTARASFISLRFGQHSRTVGSGAVDGGDSTQVRIGPPGPGTWASGGTVKRVGFDQAKLSGGVLKILSSGGKLTVSLNPDTLKMLG